MLLLLLPLLIIKVVIVIQKYAWQSWNSNTLGKVQTDRFASRKKIVSAETRHTKLDQTPHWDEKTAYDRKKVKRIYLVNSESNISCTAKIENERQRKNLYTRTSHGDWEICAKVTIIIKVTYNAVWSMKKR